ncbi:unnamed protein product [Coregonus sp. 'balchen']|nr:unnamed protein product [Coregonus sp. 'balchen']
MSSEKETLMDEIEKSLWNLTEDNLRHLCERHGPDGKDGSEIKGMNHRLLRRKIMEEMWDNTDSMKSEEQGMSWLLQLKEDIRRILEDASSALMSPSQADDAEGCDEEWNEEGGARLLSNTPEKRPIRSHTVKQHTVKTHHCSDCGKQFITTLTAVVNVRKAS